MIQSITELRSLEDPGAEDYRSLKRPAEHLARGIFIVEGDKVIYRCLESKLTVISVLLTHEWLGRLQDQLEERPESIEVFVGTKDLLQSIVGYRYHQAVMAVAKMPPRISLEETIHKIPRPAMVVALDFLESAENTGVLVRNCVACGASALIVGETSSDPYIRRAVRNSMGNVFRIPVVYSADLRESIVQLRNTFGFRVIAAHPREGSRSIYKEDLRGDCCFVFGNENDGVSERIIDVCDSSVVIPMASGVDSFNVACSSAVVLSEARRQRFFATE